MATYQRWPGISQGVGGYSRLWLGEDHLLLVTSGGISEDYRRFYFSDMQAFIIRKTLQGAVINSVLGGFAIFFLSLTLEFSSGGLLVTMLILAAFCGLAALINTLLGPTCVCFVHTATARHALPPLQRVRHARKLIDRIQPLITAVQGETTAEQLNSIRVPSMDFNTPPSAAAS